MNNPAIAECAVDIMLDAFPAQQEGVESSSAVPTPPAEGGVSFTTSDMRDLFYSSHTYGPILLLVSEADKWEGSTLDGHVTRISHQYLHENTIIFQWSDYNYTREWTDKGTGERIPEKAALAIDELIDKVEKLMTRHVRTISKHIYRDLEKEYNYLNSEESVAEIIRANIYKFDEDGEYDDSEEGVEYDDLSDRAKEKAREWYTSNGIDYDWWEDVCDTWKSRLNEMGFGSGPEYVNIGFSGFSSQGDGASFTCKSFDIRAYARYLVSGKAKDLGL
jgi:hypothetical protein